MNTSALVVALDDNVMAVECVFCLNQKAAEWDDDYDFEDVDTNKLKRYVYKTMDKSIKKDDLVIVEYGGGSTQFGFYIVKVVKVDAEVDFKNSSIKYKWIVGKVDTESLKSIKQAEKEVIAKVKKAEKRHQQKQIIEALNVDVSELKMLVKKDV